MSNAKGDRENYLNLYITKLNKGVIEDILSEKVEYLKWEYYFEAKKIDIFGKTTESDKNIFVENQISIADSRHLKSIEEIVKKAPHNSAVIWGATAFPPELLDAVAKIIRDTKDKRVEFYAVEVNANVLPILEQLNNLHILKVVDKLKMLDSFDIYNDIFDKYSSQFNENVDRNEYNFNKMTDRERTNSYIIKELRSTVKYPNIFREKRTLDTNKIRVGAGRFCCDFELVYANRNEDAYVSCQFAKPTEDLYQEIAERKKIFEDKIGDSVVCDDVNLRIATHVKEYEHKFEKIDRLVELMDKYIYYLANYTFYLGTDLQDEMWEQHKEGLLE